MKRVVLCGILWMFLGACQEASGPSAGAVYWKGVHAQTLAFGAADNSEVIKALPGGNKALLVASKSRKVTLLGVDSALTELRSQTLFAQDGGESELTHIDVGPGGSYAAVIRTLLVLEGDTVVDCQGSLVFIEISDTQAFGSVLREISVGPMPDAVDISDDGRWVVTADEVDFNDGKCPLAAVTPSITILELPDGTPASARVRARISMVHEADSAHREPEQVIIASDNDRVAVTLQDTHELLIFRISTLLEDAPVDTLVEKSTADVTITRIPNRADGAEPWPDGVARFTTMEGTEYVVTAGEFNDTFSIFDWDGTFVTQVMIQASDMPGDLPRNLEDWCKAPFRPDSVAPFGYQGHSYLAFSLKYAGAVGVWRVDEVTDIQLASVVKIGDAEGGTPETESTIGTEGISATSLGVIVTANEGESSASLVRPL